MTEQHLERIFAALDEANVRYLVVGGLAVVAHGHARMTADLDLVIAFDHDNVRGALQSLQRLGYISRAPVRAEDLADADARRRWVEEKGMVVFQLVSEQQWETAIDIFVEQPFDFDAEYRAAERIPLVEQRAVPVVTLQTLIAMKRAAGRPRDLDDVEQLRRLAEGQ